MRLPWPGSRARVLAANHPRLWNTHLPVSQRDSRMSTDVNPLLDRLCQAFPACFNRSAPQPLKIGLGEELLALAGVHPALADLTRTRIRWALKAYTGAPAYRKALARGGPRYDLNGQPAGKVTPDQQADARRPRGRQPPAAVEATASPAPRRDEKVEQALLEEVITMAIPGKLDVTLKINQLPQAKPASAQTMLFAVHADGQTVVVELKNKAWNTLKTAAENYPQWVAALTGPMGEAIEGGFRLANPALQVFERKAKPDRAATPAPESKAPDPQAAAPPAPEPKAPEPKTPAPPGSPALGYAKLSLKRRT